MQFGTSPRKAKLPVWRTVGDAYKFTFLHLPALMQIGWNWLLLLVPFSFACHWMLWPYEQLKHVNPDLFEWIVTLALSAGVAVIAAAIAVPWHRLLLLGENPSLGAGFSANARTRTYMHLAVVFVLAPEFGTLLKFLGILETTDKIMDKADGYALSVSTLLMVRWSLAFPGIAIGRDRDAPQRSWLATKDNWGRIVSGSMLSMLLCIAIVVLNITVLGKPSTQLEYAITGTIVAIVWVAAGMVCVTFLSLAYRHFFAIEPAPQMNT
jgi:hypothetical protein